MQAASANAITPQAINFWNSFSKAVGPRTPGVGWIWMHLDLNLV